MRFLVFATNHEGNHKKISCCITEISVFDVLFFQLISFVILIANIGLRIQRRKWWEILHCVISGKPSVVIDASRALHSPTRSKWPALYLSSGEKQICVSSLTRSTRRQWLFRLSKGRWFNEPADTTLLSLSLLSISLSLFLFFALFLFFSSAATLTIR